MNPAPQARITQQQARKFLQRRHPWLYSGGIISSSGNPDSGDVVTLYDERGNFLARGLWSAASDIRLRVLTWEDKAIDEAFWRERLQAAILRRGDIPAGEARRLINAENDYLPGLIVDQYDEWLVLQALTVGIDQRKGMLAGLLAELLQPRGIYERSDVDIRRKEKLPPATGPLWGEPPPALLEIQENGKPFLVDIQQGHKTGFYLDQRLNRQTLQDWTPAGARVLNTFAYTGGFSVYAYAGGAGEVLSVDASIPALELAEENLRRNGVRDSLLLAGDVFQVLRDFREQGERFDVIVLDPPKFVQSAHKMKRALRGYKDINLLGWQLLKPGGLLMTYSCSGLVSADLFRKVVFGALEDAQRDAQVLLELQAPPDHPVALSFPEGAYLKGLLCRVL